MALRRALGWAGAQTGARIVLAFFSAKITAVYLGPAGIALVGQINSFVQMTAGAIGNGADTAVVNLTAGRKTTPGGLPVLWGTALRLVLVLAGALALVVALSSAPLAAWLLADKKYWPVVIVAGLATILAVADRVILGALNGLKQVTLIAKAGIGSAVFEVCAFASLVYTFGLWGGLLGMAAICAVKLTITCIVAIRSGLVTPRMLTGAFDSGTAREIAHFYPMLLVNAVVPGLAEILVRDSVMSGLGLEAAGYLQATWRLSNMYSGVMTTALGFYFMAHYASLPNDADRATMLRRTVLQLLAMTAVAASSIYVLREMIIRVVLTPKFLPMGDLLPLHLLGDVFKMMDYPLQMALVTQRRMSWYIAQAAGGPALFAILAHACLPILSAQAAPAAYAMSHFVVLLLLLFAQKRDLSFRSLTQ